MKRNPMTWPAIIPPLIVVLGAFGGCGDDGKSAPTAPAWNPTIDPADFVAQIDNPYLPLAPGTVFTHSGITEGHQEVNRVHVTHRTKTIVGVTCTVVEDTVLVDGLVSEATLDWYAQDTDGNVWYFGEDTKELDEQGQVISTEGSWEAGVGGAAPGIAMPAVPVVGDPYHEEYLADVAEDMGQVIAVDQTVTVPLGTFTGCVQTKEWTPLEEDVVENKYYARDVGLVKVVTVTGGSDHSELVSVATE
jgi:hypothetical protein